MLMLWTLGVASAAEYRRIELADGRTLLGEVLLTTDTGLTLRLPQGDTDVSYSDVIRLDPVDISAVTSLPPLRVLILPTAGGNPLGEEQADRQLRAALASVPQTRVLSLEELPTSIPENTKNTLRGCGLDATCVVTAARTVPADVVLMPMMHLGDGVEEMVIASVWLDAPRTQRRTALSYAPSADALAVELAPAAWTVLALRAPDRASASRAEAAARDAADNAPPKAPLPAPPPTPVASVEAAPIAPIPPKAAPVKTIAPRNITEQTTSNPAFVWVPLPGFTAWADHRPGAGAAAAAVVLPATAGLVYVAGASSAQLPAVVTISTVGYYAFCVISNRVVAPVLVTPTDSGATVTVGGRF